MLSRVRLDVGTPNDERQPEGRGGPAHEPLIGVAASSAEPMIKMGDRQLPLVPGGQRVEQVKQTHGIQSARNANED